MGITPHGSGRYRVPVLTIWPCMWSVRSAGCHHFMTEASADVILRRSPSGTGNGFTWAVGDSPLPDTPPCKDRPTLRWQRTTHALFWSSACWRVGTATTTTAEEALLPRRSRRWTGAAGNR